MKKVVLMAVVAMMAAGIAQANLIPNAGFENGTGDMPDDWTALQTPGKIIWSDEAHTGSKSILLEYNNPEAILASTDPIPVTAGTEYTFSAWVKSLSGETANGTNLRLEWYDASGERIIVNPALNRSYAWYGVTALADWTEVTAVTIEAPAGAASVEHVWLYSWKGTRDNGVYIDDVSMVPEPMTLALLGVGGLMIRRRKKA